LPSGRTDIDSGKWGFLRRVWTSYVAFESLTVVVSNAIHESASIEGYPAEMVVHPIPDVVEFKPTFHAVDFVSLDVELSDGMSHEIRESFGAR
jgi:hypothetical protein